MGVYQATEFNDRWVVPRYGDPSNTLIDGLGGFDSLDFDRLLQSRFRITLDDTNGFIHIDTVSGASSTFHIRVVNVEYLSFNGGRDFVNLETLFADKTPPQIISFDPSNDATDVALDSSITLGFDEEINLMGGAITLSNSNGATVQSFRHDDIFVNGNELTIDPDALLQAGQSYVLDIAAYAVSDVFGNRVQVSNFYEFTTVANTAPVTLPSQFSLLEDFVLNSTLPPASDAESQSITYQLVDSPAHGNFTLNADGSFSYTPSAEYSGTDSFSYIASDGNLSSPVTSVNLTVAAVLDRITGSDFADTLVGNFDRDILQGGAGNDAIDGKEGLDSAQFIGARVDYSIVLNPGELQITDSGGRDGVDTLVNVERLLFSDQAIAYDLDGNAGFAAELLGLLLGPEGVSHKEYIGIAINLLDGGMPYEQLATLAFESVLGANPAHTEVVSTVYTQLVGSAPDAATLNLYAGLLDDGTYSVGQFGVLAAEHEFNQTNIGLIGLMETGLEYLPLA